MSDKHPVGARVVWAAWPVTDEEPEERGVVASVHEGVDDDGWPRRATATASRSRSTLCGKKDRSTTTAASAFSTGPTRTRAGHVAREPLRERTTAMTTGEALIWIGLICLFFAALAGVEEGIEWWAQRRKARVRRERQRAAARRRAHREAWALDYDWQTWAGEEGNHRPTPAL